ncbi:MAG: hypothetical protein NT011_13455 [Kiritimatiellaeota bacterium]|nr:hypothetical protein [Kiritimatiellota bacterium]
MSFAITITDNATPWLNYLAKHLSEPALQHEVGGEITRLLLDHLTALDEERPNALGGRRTHFYARAGKATSYAVHDNGVTVSVNQTGIAQRYFGGTIEPGPGKKYLTIPARAEAHGRRAGEFNNLEVLFGRNGPYALAERQATAIKFRKRKGGTTVTAGAMRGGGIFFWLVKSVSQDPDPSVLPDESAILNSALFAARHYAKTLTPNAQHTSD